MTSINYTNIYSRFFTKVEAYDLIADELSEDEALEFLCNYLHASVYEPYIRRLFSSVSMDDESGTIEFELRYVVDEPSDTEFISELLSYAMVYEWIQPKVHSITNIAQMFGSSDEKWYSQKNHLDGLIAIRDDAQYKMRALIRDRGYLNNSYLDGESASSKVRS